MAARELCRSARLRCFVSCPRLRVWTHVMRRILALLVTVVGLTVMPAGTASATATVFRFSDSHTETFTAPLEGCLPQNLVGVVTLKETSTGQVVDTGKRVFSVRGVNLFDYHLDLPGGRYVQSALNRDRYVFVANQQHLVYHVVTQDFRTIYAADGTPIGRLTIHAGYHVVYSDTNNNFTPDPGEVTVERGYFRLRCR